MKTHSDIEIPIFQNLGTNRWYYHFNHSGEIIQDEDGERITYKADTVVVAGNPEKQKIEAALQSPTTDKGEKDEVFTLNQAPELNADMDLIVSYTDDVYRSVIRDDVGGLEWRENEVIKTGQIRTHDTIDYECIQGHITQPGWQPNLVPALWKVYDDPSAGIPVWRQPTGAHDAYNIGAQVHFPTINDPVYESVINANVWSPAVYPQGWKKVK